MLQNLSLTHDVAVDDEFLIGMYIGSSVQDAGGIVIGPYLTLREAEPAAATDRVDAVMLDVRLRAGRTTASIAESLSDCDIPFLFCTGDDLLDEIQKRFGSCRVMMKPVQHDVLMRS